jgi:hypothetical protein
MNNFDPVAYGSVFAPLLAIDQRRPLDAGVADVAALPKLGELMEATAFVHENVADRNMAACCIAGVWLLHDFLDKSHTISQEIDTPSGSFWHAILHRREGDFSNSKYWFRHVGSHPIFEDLAMRGAELAAEHGEITAVERLTSGNQWEPFAFVDLCQAAVRGRGALRDLCLDIQQVEWELLFDFCYRAATGK